VIGLKFIIASLINEETLEKIWVGIAIGFGIGIGIEVFIQIISILDTDSDSDPEEKLRSFIGATAEMSGAPR
ncbi:MAG: hypothetical protein ACOC9D_06895, partial [Thermodesulfobacteriota bacterium]